jgi:vancomycin permeability regulator SanA
MKRLLFPLWRFARWFFLGILGVVCVCFLVICGALLQIHQQFSGNAVLPADCAIVFGAAIYGVAQPGPAIVRRVSTAAELYRNHKIHTLILSGGRGVGNTRSEASVMKQQAIGQGVSAADIVLEENSHSTWDNVLYSKNLTSHCSSVVGISDGYHLARIELIAERQGWTLTTVPAGNRPSPESEQKSIVRETFAYIYYAFHMDDWITTKSLLQKFHDTGEEVSTDQLSSAMLLPLIIT